MTMISNVARACLAAALAGVVAQANAQLTTSDRAFKHFPSALKSKITKVIIIYPENRSFDSLYGNYPGANGIAAATSATQYTGSTSTPLTGLIQPNTNGMSLVSTVGDVRFPTSMPNAFYNTAPYVPDNYCIGDMTHLFYLEQYQINAYPWLNDDPKNAGGPAMSKMSWWSSNPGLVMSYYDEQNGGEGALAKQFVLGDNCFHSAFGGSFLNHQWLIAARTPIWPASLTEGTPAPGGAATTPVDPSSPFVTTGSGNWWPAANGSGNGVAPKTLSDNALTNDPTLPGFVTSNTNTSLNSGDYWAVNTLRPLRGPAGGYVVPATAPYMNYGAQTSGSAPTFTAGSTSVTLAAAPVSSTGTNSRLPLQYHDTIGDRLLAAGHSWAWFSGGWYNAKNGNADYLFQFHHQPFAFFAKYALAQSPGYPSNGSTTKPTAGVDSTDPGGETRIGYGLGSANHLLDEDKDFYTLLDSGSLPDVSFVKPIGEDNSHPGYTSVKRGQAWVSQIVNRIMRSPNWNNTVVFICYDEHGGLFDHVQPPVIDRWGPGLRVPFIVASPQSKKGYVDHNQYETVSMLSFIEQLYDLAPLNSRDANALPLVSSFVGQPDLFVETKSGQPISYQLPNFTSPTSYTYTGTLPSGLTLDAGTGIISGTPTGSSGTTGSVTVTATGGTTGTLKWVAQVDVN